MRIQVTKSPNYVFKSKLYFGSEALAMGNNDKRRTEHLHVR
jgi:hypothetical protein